MLVVALTSVTASVGALAAPAAAARQAAAPPAIALVDHSFTVAPGAPLALRVQVAGDLPDSAELFVEVYPQLPPGDPAAVERAAAGQFDTGTVAPGPVIYPLAEVAPGPGGTLDLAIPTVVERDDQRLGTVRLAVAGVYPMRLSLRDGDTNATLTTTTSFFVRLPDEPVDDELAIALVVPLDAPVATPAQPRAPAIVDPAARARWTAAVDALSVAPDVPITLVPRPETVAALARSSSPADQALHDALRVRRDPHQVLARPYVDIDATALVQADLGDELTTQLELGSTALTEGLGVRPDRRTWLAEPDLDGATAGQLEDLAVDQWLVPAAAIEPGEPALDATRATRARVGPIVLDDVAVPNDALSAALAGSGGRPAAIALLAELASTWFASGGSDVGADDGGRGVVLVTPGEWTPDAELVATVLSELAASPLLEPLTIDGWFARVDLARDADGDPVVHPLRPEAPAEVANLAELTTSGRYQLDTLRSFLGGGPPTPEVQRLDVGLAVMASSDLAPDARAGYVARITDRVDELKGAVPALAAETITLTSRDATLGVTLENELAEPVHTLVTLQSSKLTITDRTRLVRLEPGVSTTIDFAVRARSTGSFGLTVSVGSPDGAILMRQARWTIRSTAVSGVGWVLSVGGLVFLGGWWASHARRDRRRERAALAESTARHPSGR